MKPTLSYCGQFVRKNDPDRFFLSLFAPADRREALWALFAFNHEIAKTREVVSETQLGLIRLQWWREELAKIYAGHPVPEHEILKALAQAIKTYSLPQAHFETLLYAREFDLEDVLPGDMDGLLNYADFTSAPLLKLAVQAAGGNPESEPVQPVAVNYALAGLLRAVPFHARQRRCYLPERLLREQGVNINALYEGKPQTGLPPVIQAVCAHIVQGIRPENRFLKAVQALSGLYARQIRLYAYDIYNPRLRFPPNFKELRVFWGVYFQ